MSEYSALYRILSAFGLGFLSSFTPCVFPLIPITLSIFGINESLSKLKCFTLSCSYVAGICLTYTLLGMFSAKTGVIFGSYLGNTYVVAAIIIFLLFITLITLDFFEISSLSKIQTSASKVGGKGLTGAFLMGTVSGVVAAPCIGPALVLILGIAATSNNPAWGAALLASYSLGLGLIFIVLGTFSGFIRSPPRAGNWLFVVKFIMAIGLLLVALFIGQKIFRTNLLALNIYDHLHLLFAIENIAIFLGYLAFKKNYPLLKFIASLLIAISLFELTFPDKENVQSLSNTTSEKLIRHTDFDKALEISKNSATTLMIDFYADWCAACKEFELLTFTDNQVQKRLSKYTLLRIDFTDTSTEVATRLQSIFNIPGLPCIIFLKDGNEIKESRITGFLKSSDFLEHLDKRVR